MTLHTIEVKPGVWIRMTRKQAEELGYPVAAEGTKRATPQKKTGTRKKTDG